MGIAHAYASAWKKGFSFKGRTSRSDFWWVNSLVIVLLFIVQFILEIEERVMANLALEDTLSHYRQGASSQAVQNVSHDASGLTTIYVVTMIVLLVIMVYAMALMARRLHDTNRSGAWVLIAFIPFGIFVLWIMCMFKGTDGDNQYGTDPNVYTGFNPHESHNQSAQRNQEFESKLRGSFDEQNR